MLVIKAVSSQTMNIMAAATHSKRVNRRVGCCFTHIPYCVWLIEARFDDQTGGRRLFEKPGR